MDLRPFRDRYGAFPGEQRDWPVSSEEFARFSRRGPQPVGAAALVWNKRREILLVREASVEGKKALWATPGGFAEADETPEECARREALEEAGVAIRITGLTKVVVCHVTHGERTVRFTFFQFEADHSEGEPMSGKGVRAAAWFDRLPDPMHFRGDYIEVWRRGRPTL
ncbi:MAG TPA: NUDIX hydrolase [Thermoplasmata archaeon]|nr:NUDIX hydrolase [Thermoplasmata archaeon]